MNKKLVITMSIVISIVLCFPSIQVMADNSEVLGFYTSDSVNGFFTGTFNNFDRSVGASDFYKLTNNDITTSDIEAFNNLEVTNVSDPNYCSFLVRDGNSWYYYLMQFNTTENMIVYNNNTFLFLCPYGNDYNLQINFRYYIYQNGSWSAPAGLSCANTSTFRYFQIPANSASSTLSLLYTHNIDFVSDIGEYSGSSSGISRFTDIWTEVYSNSNSFGYTNYCPSNLPFWDGSNIIDPVSPVGESNSNHLYLNDFNIGFCKPYHMENLYSAGGGYCYFTYNFDSWVNSHSSDYEFQIITQLNVDGNTTTYNSIYGLDLQGCTVLPFKGLATGYNWNRENVLFVEYEDDILFNNYNKGYVYCIGYDKYIQPSVQNTLFRGGSTGGRSTRTFVTSNGATHRLIGDNLSSEENYFNGESSHTQFLFTITVHLVDKVSGDVSGSFVKTFNLLTGVSNVTSNSIRDNTNPYQVSNDELELPVIDSGGGYGYGGNNQLVNFQFPSDIELFIDNGFKQFLSWYETSADTAYATNRFWSSMGIFEGNPATELYSEYFGFLPDDFKTLILSCAGIGIVGGAFCILRRRLH